jgi:hypothetical protein
MKTYSIKLGEQFQIPLPILYDSEGNPADPKTITFNFSSRNPSIVRVDRTTGLCTAKAIDPDSPLQTGGSAVITCLAQRGIVLSVDYLINIELPRVISVPSRGQGGPRHLWAARGTAKVIQEKPIARISRIEPSDD